MNALVPAAAAAPAISAAAVSPAPAAPYSVGNFQKGEARMEVSKQWIARPDDQKFLSLDALRDAVHARSARASEAVFSVADIEIIPPVLRARDDTERLAIGLPDGRIISPTNWSFGQLCEAAAAPAGYLRTLASPLVAENLNYGLRYNRRADHKKFYADAAELLACTGTEYGRIFDHEVVAAVQNVAGNGTGDERWKVPGALDWATMTYDPEHPVTLDTTTLFASDRDVFIFLVDDRNPIEVGKLPNGEPDLMFRGFYVSNSEVGNGALKIACFYLRAVCCNRILWGVEGFQEISMRHTRLAPARFLEEARPALISYANGSVTKLLDGVAKAQAAKLADDDDGMLDFLINRGLTKVRAGEIMETVEREEGRKARSAWDIAQGISAVARSIPNADDRLRLELAVKPILDKVA